MDHDNSKRIKLIANKVINSLRSEERMLADNPKDMLYDIRMLRALQYYGDKPIVVREFNSHNQAFLDEFEVWTPSGAWEEVVPNNHSLEAMLSQEELATNGHTWRHIWNIQRFILTGSISDIENTLPRILREVVRYALTNSRECLSQTTQMTLTHNGLLAMLKENTVNYVTAYLKPFAQVHGLTSLYDNLYTFEINRRCLTHDQSKLVNPELGTFVEYTPKLKGVQFGSAEYKSFLEGMAPALANHYANNRHHPEYYKHGVQDMNFFDVYEMMCDWMASSLRTKDGSFQSSIDHCKVRFEIDEELCALMLHTFDQVFKDEYARHQSFYYSQTLPTETGTYGCPPGPDGEPGPAGYDTKYHSAGGPGPDGDIGENRED